MTTLNDLFHVEFRENRRIILRTVTHPHTHIIFLPMEPQAFPVSLCFVWGQRKSEPQKFCGHNLSCRQWTVSIETPCAIIQVDWRSNASDLCSGGATSNFDRDTDYPDILPQSVQANTAIITLIRPRPHRSRNRDRAVGIATGYGLYDRGVGVRVPMESRFVSSSTRPDWLWCPPSLLSNGYQGLFSRG
jgi:hypothetical protein